MAKATKNENAENADQEGPVEIAIVGDITEHENEISEKLLDISIGGECVLYFDSPGGSAYSAISLLTLITIRELRATGIVIGECSSAAIWPLAACRKRMVTPYSFLLFHPIRWQSEEAVQLAEAAEWARHFGHLEQEMDSLLARFLAVDPEQLAAWMKPGRYVTGEEFVEAGLAKMIDLAAYAAPGHPKRR
jgi:ATP-dependent protease ClpP protease subunit